MAPNKMQGHFWHQFLTQFSMLFHMVPLVLLSMVALITTYFKESDWLLKNLHQSESGWKSYHGEQNRGYHVKEHTKLCQKQLSKVTLHFVWGQLSRKQTVIYLCFCLFDDGKKAFDTLPFSVSWMNLVSSPPYIIRANKKVDQIDLAHNPIASDLN